MNTTVIVAPVLLAILESASKSVSVTSCSTETIFSSLQSQLKEENDRGINTGTNYDMHYDLLQYVAEWWECQTEPDCKRLLQRIEEEKGIFLGEFVKALLKINNVSTEFEQIAEQVGDIELLHKLHSIPSNTLKFIATNQSLYV